MKYLFERLSTVITVSLILPSRPDKLQCFHRISLAAGEEQEVSFTLKPERDTRRYDVKRKAYVVDAGRYEVQIGASSQDIRQKASFRIR